MAMLERDRSTIEQLIVPNPDASVLWEGQPLPPDAMAHMKVEFQQITCRKAAVGEQVLIPDGRALFVTPQMSNDDRPLYVLSIGDRDLRSPLWLHRVDGAWKIDAGPIIAGRVGAAKARRERGI